MLSLMISPCTVSLPASKRMCNKDDNPGATTPWRRVFEFAKRLSDGAETFIRTAFFEPFVTSSHASYVAPCWHSSKTTTSWDVLKGQQLLFVTLPSPSELLDDAKEIIDRFGEPWSFRESSV
jgi:hypothetical protein